MKNNLLATALAVAMCFGAAGCSSAGSGNGSGELKTETVYNGKGVAFLAEAAEEYLNATTADEQARVLQYYVGDQADFQRFVVRWEKDGGESYKISVADNKEFENAAEYETSRRSIDVGGTLVPGKTYYYKIKGEKKTSKVDSFVIKNSLRPINVDGAHNVRDLGGYDTASGKKISYGKIYRGGRLNSSGNVSALSKDGQRVMTEALGIKTEIDLRFTDVDDGSQTESILGENVKYVKAPCSQYGMVLPKFKGYGLKKRGYVKGSKESIKKIFTTLADENNYPVYFHCNAGADRTGTIACLIEAILGVADEDMIKDFELTSFSAYGKRYRGEIKDGKFINGVMQDNDDNFVAFGMFMDDTVRFYGDDGDSFSVAAEKFLKNACGVTDEEISSVRNILLGE